MHKGVGWLIGQHYQGRGRKSKLTKDQKNKLVELIKKGPEDNGFHCGIWNTAMIAELIWLKFEVRYNLNYLIKPNEKTGLQLSKSSFCD
ncbi:helix-turn-helix domain-containing protein [Bathymodiolus japonicus methanotrophic gill symbiont]|nr:helix-turn-helix domain-containing protein [Bathymodiolus japonicus methanotrophic gill symbiont]